MSKNILKAVIVDDEILARKRIRRLLEPLDDIEIITECSNGLETIEFLENHKTDLLFLDVQMPELNGFEVLDKLSPEKLPYIIFVTAYDKYAIKAFEVHAVDYLLKPFEDERFYKSLDYAKEVIYKDRIKDTPLNFAGLLSEYKSAFETKVQYPDRITIKSSGSFYILKTTDIIRIKADGKYLEVLTADHKYNVRKTMNEMETELDPDNFVRIHRSTIINCDYVKEIQHWYKTDFIILLTNNEKFTTSKSFKPNLDKLLKN